MKIYLASPFFNETEIVYVSQAEQILRARGFDVFSPREHEVRDAQVGSRAWSEQIFDMDVKGLESADCMVMLYHGNYSDSGTAWECGYAYGMHIPVIVVQIGTLSNLMVHESALANIRMEDLASYDFENRPKITYEGDMT